jgi:predicted nucleic acid-binding protein
VSVFIDTSALFAVLDADDQNHQRAKKVWLDLLAQDIELVCTNYILLETFALVQRRLGIDATRALQQDVVPVLHVEWVRQASHTAAATALLIAARRQLSLVDCVSFETMRRLGLQRAFTFDRHFADQGFECIPVA